VAAAGEKNDGELFEKKMKRLAVTLAEDFAESAKLEKAIRDNLKRIGYGQ
jgi:type I restriction enzyme M protein